MKKILFGVFLCLFTLSGQAKEQLQPLPPEKAFVFSAQFNQPNQLTLEWHIASDYYLYRDRVHFSLLPPSPLKVTLPPGISKHDAIQGTYQVYTGTLKIVLPLNASDKNALILDVRYQGCSQHGFCYSPIKKTVKLNLVNQTISTSAAVGNVSETSSIENIFAQHNLFIILISFLGLGLLLAFTPCVLPMVPILSGIIMGHRKKSSTITTFSLSLAYVLGMAVTYAIAGVVVALVGSSIQTELQKAWVIVLFSGIFILLALSLFGLYEFHLPSRWQKRLTDASNKQKSGTYLGVFIMGSISCLIVSPCISPALVGVLAYIAHTGNVWLGALSLLALGIGMGLPLLLLGASVGKFLPKAGAWMQTIEHLVGIMMLAFAIWLLSRIIPGPLTLFLWSVLLIVSAIMMGDFKRTFTHWQHLRHGLASAAIVYGLILMLGAFLGNSDPLHPWENWQLNFSKSSSIVQPTCITLKNMEQFNQTLLQARQEKKWVMLDFYADWCESCVHMERYVFKQPRVLKALENFIWLRADITANNTFDQAIMKRFHIIAPPMLLFFAPNGKELLDTRLIGETTTKELLAQLQHLKESGRGH